MIGRTTLLLFLILLLYAAAGRGAETVRRLESRVERVEGFLSNLQGATVEIPR